MVAVGLDISVTRANAEPCRCRRCNGGAEIGLANLRWQASRPGRRLRDDAVEGKWPGSVCRTRTREDISWLLADARLRWKIDPNPAHDAGA